MKRLCYILKKIFSKKQPTYAEKIGKMGEDATVKYLKNKGLKIIARNWRSGKNEIDIICKDGDVLVFVEVKTRKSSAVVGGYFAGVQKGKKIAVKTAAKDYMRRLKKRPNNWRFDVVAVEHNNTDDALKIHHYENVY